MLSLKEILTDGDFSLEEIEKVLILVHEPVRLYELDATDEPIEEGDENECGE